MNLIIVFTLLFCLFLSPSAQAREYPISSGRSIEQRADSLFEMVSKELVFTTKKQGKFKAIQMTTEQLRQLLNGEETSQEQTAYIKEYISALKSLPSAKEFKISNCDEYIVEEKAEQLLQSLCGQSLIGSEYKSL